MRALAALAGVAAVALAAAHAPLWVYAVSLALFGLPHVLVELRYVDERFSGRVPRGTLRWLGAGLLCVAGLRVLAFAGVEGPLVRAELAFGVGLVAVAAPLLTARVDPLRALGAFGAASLLLGGAVYAPVETLVCFALLHNLTPVGFLAERLRGRARRQALAAAATVFFLVPVVLVASPFLPQVLDGPLAIGDLSRHEGAFVPSPWTQTALGARLFAAAAYLQVMHYAVVLGVLPKLGGGDEASRAVAPWPSKRTFAVGVAILGAVATGAFVTDFVGARAGYAVFAAVHAWVEIPTLLIACTVGPIAGLKAQPT
jgi:hypothetical protein